MGAAERRENERAAVGLAFVHAHTGDLFIGCADLGNIGEIKTGINALRIHIERKRDNVDVTRAFAVTEKRTFDTVAPCEKSHFTVGNRTSAVVVGVQGDHEIFSAMQILAHIFDLICVNVGHGVRHGYGQVDDDLIVGSGLPDIDDLVADLCGEFRLGTREAFGRIFKDEVSFRLFSVFKAELRTELRDLDDLLLGFFEHLLALCDGGGVIEMNDGVFRTAQSLKGLGNDMLSRLRQNLNGDVVGDHIVFDQRAAEFVFRLARRGETDLDLLEADLDEKLEEFELFLKAHRDDERLIAVAQVHAAPNRRLVEICFLRPVGGGLHGEKLFCVFFVSLHNENPFCECRICPSVK